MEEAADRPDHLEYAFRRACSWSMFTLDRDMADWMYSTFIRKFPGPFPLPIATVLTNKEKAIYSFRLTAHAIMWRCVVLKDTIAQGRFTIIVRK